MSGERGPKGLPANVHMLRGNAGHKALGALLDEVPRPDAEIPDCPEHLTGEARAEWERITPFLLKIGLVSQLDRAALAAYCTHWATHVWASQRINEINQVDATGERGRISKTPNGYEQISALMTVNNRALDGMARYLAMFGLSPSDRSRVTASDPQLGLPGIESKPKADGWGNF